MLSMLKKIHQSMLSVLLISSISLAHAQNVPTRMPTLNLENPSIPESTRLEIKSLLRGIEMNNAKLEVLNAIENDTVDAKVGPAGGLKIGAGIVGFFVALKVYDTGAILLFDGVKWVTPKKVWTAIAIVGAISFLSLATGAYEAYKNRYYRKVKDLNSDKRTEEATNLMNDSEAKLSRVLSLSEAHVETK